MGDALNAAPEMREKFAQAVADHISDIGQKSLSRAITTAEDLFKRIRDTGLIDPAKEQAIMKELRDIFVMPADLKTRINMTQRAIRSALMTGARAVVPTK